MVMFTWGANLYSGEPPADGARNLRRGKQWMWKVQHLEGRREINGLHIPLGRKLTMTRGRDPQLLHPGVPHQGTWCRAGIPLWFEPTMAMSFIYSAPSTAVRSIPG